MSPASGEPVPFIPRRHFVGGRIGYRRALRRGDGTEVAGTRPYRPGDLAAHIDWQASARLSAARGVDEFVVREFFADETPCVVVVRDGWAGMAANPPPSPWLDKAAAAQAAVDIVVSSAGFAGLEVLSVAPRRANGAGRDAALATGSVAAAVDQLFRRAASVPAGSFVFLISDFLDQAPVHWTRLQPHRWDVIPVIVQDPVWEQSFPPVGAVSVRLRDARTGDLHDIYVSRREAASRARDHEQRLAGLVRRFRGYGFDPLVVGSDDREHVAGAFQAWARRRRQLLSVGA